MPDSNEVVEAIAQASSWNARVSQVRRIPELFGISEHAGVYAAIARRIYVPTLTPEFAYVHWRDEYELPPLEAAYAVAARRTTGFTEVSRKTLAELIGDEPTTLRVFRLLLGLTGAEFAEACSLVAEQEGLATVSKTVIKNAEQAGRLRRKAAETVAATIDLAMSGKLFPPNTSVAAVRSKLDKPDTQRSWESVREYAANGVPFPVFLHQRQYGGAFRQLLDATSAHRGDLIEDPVAELFTAERVPFIRTGSHNQAAVEERFGLTVRPAPDFVIFDPRNDGLKAILECKGANDGGTARDKAGRFVTLRNESRRLGGVPVFAVLGGIGWRRAADGLGPVIRDTDGRVFTLATLREMLEVEPFPALHGLAEPTGDEEVRSGG